MPDARFYKSLGAISVSEALRLASGATPQRGNLSILVDRAAAFDEEDLHGAVVYLDSTHSLSALAGRRPALCFAPAGTPQSEDFVFAVADPRAAFGMAAHALHRERTLHEDGHHPSIGMDVRIHPSAVVGPGAIVGDGVRIDPCAVIGPGVVIGRGTVIAAGAVIACAVIGEEVSIGAGCAIGGPGFGYIAGPEGAVRVPQLGRVILGNRVELGANVAIDRGALGDTVVGAGTKLDNLVHIAHNVQIGRNCLVAGQVGIAGSSVIGDRVQFGGQAGIADHLTIGDDARIGAKAGVMRNVPAGETWGGYPAKLMRAWLKETAIAARAARSRKSIDEKEE